MVEIGLEMGEEDEQFSYSIIFGDEATFHLKGKVNDHDERIRGLESPRVVVK